MCSALRGVPPIEGTFTVTPRGPSRREKLAERPLFLCACDTHRVVSCVTHQVRSSEATAFANGRGLKFRPAEFPREAAAAPGTASTVVAADESCAQRHPRQNCRASCAAECCCAGRPRVARFVMSPQPDGRRGVCVDRRARSSEKSRGSFRCSRIVVQTTSNDVSAVASGGEGCRRSGGDERAERTDYCWHAL